jgi:hypothetical protein
MARCPSPRGKYIYGLALAFALLAPAGASADVICVPLQVPGCDDHRTTIAAATSIAVTGDTVRIAAGTYAESVDAGTRTLTFEGAGPSATVIAPTSAGVALTVPHGGTLRSLGLKGFSQTASGNGSDALDFFATGAGSTLDLLDVSAAGGNGGSNFSDTGGAGVNVQNSDNPANVTHTIISGSTLTGGNGPSLAGAGVSLTAAGGTASFRDSTFQGGSGLGFGDGFSADNGVVATVSGGTVTEADVENSTLTATRTRFLGRPGSLGNYEPGLFADTLGVLSNGSKPSAVTLVDSQVFAPGPGSLPGSAVSVASGNAASTLLSRGSTIVGEGKISAVGVIRSTGGSPPVSASLVNSVARVQSPTGATDLSADNATITADHSSFTTVAKPNGGSAPAPGSPTNVAGDPQFTSATDFSLKPTSPLIDKGDPAIVTTGELDLAGAARSLDGNGDCLARPDVGAFERPALACPVVANLPPGLSGVNETNKAFAPVGRGGHITAARKHKRKVKRGTRFRYTLSEAAKVTITIERKLKGRRVKRGKKRVCARPTRKNRKKRRCTRFKRAGILSAQKAAGRQNTPFTGRLKGKALKRGSYRATLVATDAQGAKSKPRRLTFRIVKP